ncbi:hypothetical protein B0O99DRAFT_137941 [Bisporella sp. PMI_857]|nr:hypothetical protein B0O99DRAFT_137941 [Bisporella sp. PMI_857]
MTDRPIDDDVLRSTGLLERFFIHRNNLKFYNTVAVTATYTVPRSFIQAASKIEKVVYAALQHVVNKHPILGVALADRETLEPKWVRLDEIDLQRLVTIVEADPRSNLDEVMQYGHQIPLKYTDRSPLWRIVVSVVKSQLDSESNQQFFFSLGFYYHHGIGDGASGGIFHLDFHDALNSLIANSTVASFKFSDSALIAIPKRPLLPTLEEKVQFPLSFWFTLKQVVNAFIYSPPANPLTWFGPPIQSSLPDQPPTVQIHSISLGPAIVSNLVAKCRHEQTTITALFTVLVARKLAFMYPRHSRFVGGIPCSLRKFSGHTDRDIGVFLSDIMINFSSELEVPSGHISCSSDPAVPISEDVKLWDSARMSKAWLVANTTSTTDQTAGLLKFVKNDMPGYFLSMLGKPRKHAFEVTNIMVLDGGAGRYDEGKAMFDRIVLTASRATNAPPYLILLATAKGGDMTVTLCREDGIVSCEEGREMMSWLESQLKAMF